MVMPQTVRPPIGPSRPLPSISRAAAPMKPEAAPEAPIIAQ